MRVIVLGSGGSSGTPAVDWGWGRCDPEDPRNWRTRPAILVEEGATRLLVDTPPDLRFQLLAAGVNTVDAVLYTHSHADHLHGIDDLRAINRVREAPLDCYADEQTLDTIRTRFAYATKPISADAKSYYRPTLVLKLLKDGDSLEIRNINVSVFEQDHGFTSTLGFRFGDVAYTTDVVELSDRAFGLLDGVGVWIIGTLVDHPHPTHCHIDKALAWIARIGPRRAILTHIGLGLDHATLQARLPSGVEVAYDGMIVDV
jgi:phosphoribosyl 1,2-cyclic phosphate phosphodiesterase